MKKKMMLIILDGWGLGQYPDSDAIYQAETPIMDSLMKIYPNSTLKTFGQNVGLPAGQMGNSEVGHLNIGAGRVVFQDLAMINNTIAENQFFENQAFKKLDIQLNKNNGRLHIMGLLSDGGVHSHINHLLALCKHYKNQPNAQEVYLHLFLDGRDTDPMGGINYLQTLKDQTDTMENVHIASLIGRYYAMDRDHRWERIKLAYDLLVHGKGEHWDDPILGLLNQYEQNITDEFIMPLVCDLPNHLDAHMKPNDAVFFYNFRTDRPRQLTTVLTQSAKSDFDLKPINLYFVTMTEYDKNYKNIEVVFKKENLKMTLGEVLEKQGKTQVRIAETEKYPHVTFFFNGGREEPFVDENRILIPSPKVATYDLKPEMSALEVTNKIVAYTKNDKPDFVCLNFANTDMVGHTGDFEAAMIAANTVDHMLTRLVQLSKEEEYGMLIIADHGNSDYMINIDGSPNTAHTTNLVPCIFVTHDKMEFTLKNGSLADVAPTILKAMGLPQPPEMTGDCLFNYIKKNS